LAAAAYLDGFFAAIESNKEVMFAFISLLDLSVRADALLFEPAYILTSFVDDGIPQPPVDAFSSDVVGPAGFSPASDELLLLPTALLATAYILGLVASSNIRKGSEDPALWARRSNKAS
jgi:hypothetical protein